MREKVINIYQTGKSYKTVSNELGLKWTTFRAIILKCRKREKALQKHMADSFMRSQKNPVKHLKHCRSQLHQLRSVFMIKQKEREWVKIRDKKKKQKTIDYYCWENILWTNKTKV